MSKRSRSDENPAADEESVAKKARPQTPPSIAPQTPLPGRTKVLSWNVETPVPFLDLTARKAGPTTVAAASNLSLLRDLIVRSGYPDLVCLQEVRARHTDKEWIAALKNAPNGTDGGPLYATFTSLNKAVRGQRHFGVVTYARYPENIAVAREVDWDAEGRVMILEMKSGWALVNVYALNGNEYMWRDVTGRCAPKTRNERKREFNRLLMEECQMLQARGFLLVLVGDFNISLAKRDCVPRLRTEYPHSLARKEFTDEFIPGLDVVDVYRTLHGDRPAFSWFAKGKPEGADAARVDYALVQRSIVDRVMESMYMEDPEDRAHSDHAPFVLTLRDMDNLPPPLLHPHALPPHVTPTDNLQPLVAQPDSLPPHPPPMNSLQPSPTIETPPQPDADPPIDPSLQMDPQAFGLLVEQAVAASAAAASS